MFKYKEKIFFKIYYKNIIMIFTTLFSIINQKDFTNIFDKQPG